jgi:hypothetical protein
LEKKTKEDMKKLLIILLLAFLGFKSQATPKGIYALGEYVSFFLDTVAHRAYLATEGALTLLPGDNFWVSGIWCGAHNGYVTDSAGNVYSIFDNSAGQGGIGNTTNTSVLTRIMTDSLGNPFTGITFISAGGTAYGNFWNVAFMKSNNDTVWICGNTQGGIEGNGTWGCLASTRPVPIKYPSPIAKIQCSSVLMAMTTAGAVYTNGAGGYNLWLGQGSSPTWMSPGLVTLTGGQTAIDIANDTRFGYIQLANKHLDAIGDFQSYEGIPSGGASPSPQDVTSTLGLPDSIQTVSVNNEGSYVILYSGDLWGWGGNINSNLGNGALINWEAYNPTSTSPFGGSTPLPWDWNQGQGQVTQNPPVHIAPYKHNFSVFCNGTALVYGFIVIDANDSAYCAGRNKTLFPNGVIDGNPANGNIAATYPNSWDIFWLTYLSNPLAVSTIEVTSRHCLLFPSTFPCNVYSNPTTTAPTASAGPNQSLPTGTTATTLSVTASAQSGFSLIYHIWYQVSGPTTAIFNMPSALSTYVANLTNGTYVFGDSVTDQTWNTTYTTMQVVIGGSPATGFYVSSSTGSDGNTGTSASPFATYAHALAQCVSGDTIYLKRGDTFTATLYTITGLTIEPYGTGTKPIITGAVSLSTWANYGSGIYAAKLPNDRSNLNLVTVDGNLAGVGRYPDTGYAPYTGLTSSTLTAAAISIFPFTFANGTATIRDEFSVIDTVHITAQGSNTLSLATSPSILGGRGNGFFVQGHPNTLKTTLRVGSWWNNVAADTMEMFFGSAGPSGHTVLVGMLDTLVYNSGDSNVVINGIEFDYSNQFSIFENNTYNIAFDSCTLKYEGNNGVRANNAQKSTFLNDTIKYANNNGAYNTGTSPYLILKNSLIDSCGMTAGMGQSGSSSTYEGWAWGNVFGQLIQNCTFINTGYNGLYFSGDSANILNNSLSNYCMVKCDGAAVYTWDPSLAGYTYGRNVTGNVALNGGYPGSGIVYDATDISFGFYGDNNASKTTYSNNTAAFNVSAGAMNHNINTTYTGNNWYGNGYCQFLNAEQSSHAITGLVYTGNIHGLSNSGQLSIAFTTPNNDLASMGTVNNNYYLAPTGTTATFFTKSSADAGTSRTLASWQSDLSYDLGSSYQQGTLSFQYSMPGGIFYLGGNFKDAFGNIIPGNLTLSPYSSKTLLSLPCSCIQIPTGSKILVN